MEFAIIVESAPSINSSLVAKRRALEVGALIGDDGEKKLRGLQLPTQMQLRMVFASPMVVSRNWLSLLLLASWLRRRTRHNLVDR
jgi:hypothetical protein